MNEYYVYIMTNHNGTLYTGVTSNLARRVYEHRNKLAEGFTKRYNISKLVYYETTTDVHAAVAREKQIKGWLRRRKVALIESVNPSWVDLAADWYEDPRPHQTLRSTQGDIEKSGDGDNSGSKSAPQRQQPCHSERSEESGGGARAGSYSGPARRPTTPPDPSLHSELVSKSSLLLWY